MQARMQMCKLLQQATRTNEYVFKHIYLYAYISDIFVFVCSYMSAVLLH